MVTALFLHQNCHGVHNNPQCHAAMGVPTCMPCAVLDRFYFWQVPLCLFRAGPSKTGSTASSRVVYWSMRTLTRSHKNTQAYVNKYTMRPHGYITTLFASNIIYVVCLLDLSRPTALPWCSQAEPAWTHTLSTAVTEHDYCTARDMEQQIYSSHTMGECARWYI